MAPFQRSGRERTKWEHWMKYHLHLSLSPCGNTLVLTELDSSWAMLCLIPRFLSHSRLFLCLFPAERTPAWEPRHTSLSTHLPPATRPVAILEDARELRASLLSLSQSSQPFSTPAAASNSRERHRFPGKWEAETRHSHNFPGK